MRIVIASDLCVPLQFLSKETLSTQSVEAKVTRNDAVVSLLVLVFRIKDKFVMVGSKTVRNYAQARVC